MAPFANTLHTRALVLTPELTLRNENRGGGRTGFDCVSLGPTEFKELFRTNFGVLLHPRDLGVLVRVTLLLLLLVSAYCSR